MLIGEGNYSTLIQRQEKMTKHNDTSKECNFYTVGPFVAVEGEDSGLWIHSTVKVLGNASHNSMSYRIKILIKGKIVIRNAKQVKKT